MQTGERYNIYVNDVRKFTRLTEEEYLNMMEDLAIEFYETGSPNPKKIRTEVLRNY
jgi:hypothetical protein